MSKVEKIIGMIFAIPGVILAAWGELRDMFKY
jgi:hypothetical protein